VIQRTKIMATTEFREILPKYRSRGESKGKLPDLPERPEPVDRAAQRIDHQHTYTPENSVFDKISKKLHFLMGVGDLSQCLFEGLILDAHARRAPGEIDAALLPVHATSS
jgi:hypothetical protein